MGFFYRALDAADNAITDTVTRSAEHRKARKWAAGAPQNGTVWSTETHRDLFGRTQELAHEHRVRNGKVGHQTLAGFFLTAGNPSTAKPRGVMTKDEYDAMEVAGPDAGQAAADARPKRGIFGGRRAA